MTKLLTIIITYLNRKKQLYNTLQSLKQYGEEVNIIIVDDNSTDGENIICFEGDNIKIITLRNKTWMNPVIPFNVGFKEAKSGIILMQGAECIHLGNIVNHVLANIEKNVYLSYAALSIDRELTERLFNKEDVYSIINPHLNDFINKNGGTGWYNHSKYRPEALHFCCAIMGEDLYELGGFDERYANGLGYDDFDFIHRIRQKGMSIKIIDSPFVVHQFHEPFNPGPVPTLMAINEPIYKQAKSSHDYDVKKYNKIFTIKNEIPKKIFFYWGNKKMSWMRYMTLYSFRKMNPDWEMILYYTKDSEVEYKTWKTDETQDFFNFNGEDYINRLNDLNIIIKEWNLIDNKIIDISLKMGASHRSNFFKWSKLYEEGGIYSDLDVIYFRPINDFYNKLITNKYDVAICQEEILSIGLLASKPNNGFFKDIFINGTKNVNLNKYESAGTANIYDLYNNVECNEVLNEAKKRYPYLNFYNISKNLIYFLDSTQIDYAINCPQDIYNFPKESIGYHWYGAHPSIQNFNNILNENNYDKYDITFTRIAKNILYL